MKSNRKRRILATILCMVMVLTNSFSILAEEAENMAVPVAEKEVPAADAEISETETESPKVLQELKYEDEQVSVVVTAVEEGAIPTGATLKVLPVTLENNKTKAQYEDVAKRIQEKVAEEEKEVAGFLAYDITLVDSEGNEVEPNSKVKVSMNYKNATLPEEVRENGGENAEVSVFHLEEDENGNVKNVVNMSEKETTKVDTLTTAEGPLVQNVEVETESFSVFTLTWKTVLGKHNLEITVVDKKGQKIVAEQLQDVEITEATNVAKIAENIKIENYKFLRAGIGNSISEALNESNAIEQLRCRFGKWEYKKSGESPWTKIESGSKVYFVFESTKRTDFANCYTENGDKISNENIDLKAVKETDILSGLAPQIPDYEFLYVTIVKKNESLEVKRLSMTEEGLRYSVSDSGDFWENVGTDEIRFLYRKSGGQHPTIVTENTSGLIDINLYDYENGETFGKFKINKGTDELNYNQWVGYWGKNYDRHAVQGIVENKLYTANGQIAGEADNYQGFPKIVAGGDQHIAKDLFGNPVASGLNHLFTKDDNGYYEYDSSAHYAYYDRNGNTEKNFIVYANPKKKGNDEFGEFMPLRDFDENAEWQYGMTIGFNFIQPENGKVNGKDMIFEFSGDDDVWVFVDGKLVLDIGGIHGIVGGSINFNTGDVKVERVVDKSVSEIGKWYSTLGTSTTLKKIFNLKRDTFEDYTEHRVEFFYLERGAGDANCKLRFNMPPIPKDSLQVKKEITNTDKEKYANVEFSFEVWLETKETSEDCEQVEGTYYKKLEDGTPYKIYKDGQDTGKSGVIQNGIFKLKHGESALFEEIDRNLKYYAVETEVSSDEFDKVEIPNWNVSYEDENGIIKPGTGGEVEPGQQFIAKSEPKRVGGNSVIIFRNRCSSANKRELWITKKMAEGQENIKDTFAFKVFLEGTDGSFVPYGAGNSYYVVDENGSTENTLLQKVPDDGVIRGIKAGQSIVLTNILSGTEFRVEEVDLDTSQYYEPVKEVEESTCDSGTIKDENGNLISDGTIKLHTDAKVTVTNKKRVNTFHIKKVDSENPNKVLYGAKFKLERKNGDGWEIVKTELITDEKGMITVSELPNGYYRMTETAPPEGYIMPETKIYEFSLPYDGKNKDESVIVEENSKLPNGLYGEITKIVENQRTSWEIYKRSSSNKNLFLGGAEFELKSTETAAEGKAPKTYYGVSSSKEPQKGKIVWYSSKDYEEKNQITEEQIEPGTYTFREIKAPVGYALSSETWSIKIGSNGNLISVNGNQVTEENTKTQVIYYFENTPLYELPSAGGTGIFGYTIGGTLLLMAATLLLYKMKRKEVLKS